MSAVTNGTIAPLSFQYYATHLLLHRPFLNDSSSSALRICCAAAGSMSYLLRLYKRAYTFRRMSSVAVHQIFTAATTLVYILWRDNEQNGSNDISTAPNMNSHREDLLVCLAALSALAARMVHARRSYLSVILLMKKYKVSLDVLQSGPPGESSRTES